MSNALRMPNVGGAPGTVSRDPAQAPDRVVDRGLAENGGIKKTPDDAKDFKSILGNELTSPLGGQVKEPIKFSNHASARVQSRGIDVGPDVMRRLNDAVDKAAAKGVDEALVLSSDGAFIVSVKNRTVVTAMDKNALDGNVFTNIDGAVIL